MKRPAKNIDRVLVNLLRKRILWILFGLALLGILLLIILPMGIEYGFQRYLLSQGVDQIYLEDVDFNPFTRRLALKNLIVEVDNEQVLNVSEADFTLSLPSFFKKRFLLEKVDFNNSMVMIEELPDGRWRIGGLSPAPSEANSPASTWGFGLSELQIQNSLLKFRSSQFESNLSIAQARLTRLRTWRPDQRAHFELSGQLNDSGLQFQGDLSPIGGGMTFEGALQLNGLAITPFAQLMASDPSKLQGRLNANVRIQTQYSSKEGFNFSQSGRLALKQARMRFGDVDLAEENLTWDGAVEVKRPTASGEVQISATGKLEAQAGTVNPVPDDLMLRHSELNWNGKFVMAQTPETAKFTFAGELRARKLNMATVDLNLEENNLTWDGSVQIEMPGPPDTLSVAATGQMDSKGSLLDSTSQRFKFQDDGLNCNGTFALVRNPEKSDFKFNGALKLLKLKMITPDVSLADKSLTWNGKLEFSMPENAEQYKLATDGKLESEGQVVTFSRGKLNIEHGRLRWNGKFDLGLKNFPAGLAAIGDFSTSDLAVTDVQGKFRLWESKAVELSSIKADANRQFSVASVKIAGLNLAGQSEPAKNASLFSATEVQVDSIILERLKKLSIQSARIVDARGELHLKDDGHWLYINELATFLANYRGAQKKPLPSGSVKNARRHDKKADAQINVQIGKLEIVGDSELHFTDETVNPTFRTELRLKKALLTDFDSAQPENTSPFSLEATSRKYTDLKLQGTVQPFGERISMELKGKIRAAELPPLSPYAVKAIGYSLISGEMNADINLKILAGQMEGNADLKFRDPILAAVSPEKFQNRQGSPIPLQSALEVLRDKDGDIRLNIPISGDVTDPQFSFADAFNQALIKSLTFTTLSYLKYMLGPYGTAIGIIEIGTKVGEKLLTAIRLNPIEFQPGVSELDAAALEYVDKVAAIMKEKKDVRLRLCGWATESDRLGQSAATEETSTASSGAETQEIKSAPGSRLAAAKDAAPLSDGEMLELAQRRADQIEALLVSTHGIKDKRIFICKPEIDDSPEAKPRVEMAF